MDRTSLINGCNLAPGADPSPQFRNMESPNIRTESKAHT